MGIDPGNVDTRYDRIGVVVLVSWIELPQSEIHPLLNWGERKKIKTRSIYIAITAHTTTNVMFLFATYGARFQGGSALTNHAHFVLFRGATSILLLLATGRRH